MVFKASEPKNKQVSSERRSAAPLKVARTLGLCICRCSNTLFVLNTPAITLPLLVQLSLDAPRSFTSMCMMLTVPNWKPAAGAWLPAHSGADWAPPAHTA
jgi:hypothetical protein